MPIIYPPSPIKADLSLTKPSAKYRQQVIKVTGTIVLFILTYLILFLFACGFALATGYSGILLISSYPNFITIILGLGLLISGLMVVYFLIKFLFASNKTDQSHLLEVKENDQPELFEFVRKITAETKAPFPKRIYLSSEVNASVFYDAGFLSLIFPARKNLHIGLGLVNSINTSEFKAILAHEFGHFSQDSMKLGNYVYYVNRAIHNMLYENYGMQNTLNQLARFSNGFVIISWITVFVIEGMQTVLKQVYDLINTTFSDLSREMEFHADTISAVVSGGNHLALALRRLEVTQTCFDITLSTCQNLIPENIKAENIFPAHAEIIAHFSNQNGLHINYGLPIVTKDSFSRFKKNKINIKDQWASHPSTDDREDHLNTLNLVTQVINESAWIVFRNQEELQKKITRILFKQIQFNGIPVEINHEELFKRYLIHNEKYSFSNIYKGFYNNRDISVIDLQANVSTVNKIFPDDYLTDENLSLPIEINCLQSDLEILKLIMNRSIEVSTFDYDGKRCKRSDAKNIYELLTKELSQKEQQLKDVDSSLFHYFNNLSPTGEIKNQYELFNTIQNERKEHLALYQNVMQNLAPIFETQLDYEEAKHLFLRHNNYEKILKNDLEKFLNDEEIGKDLSVSELDLITRFIKTNVVYVYSEQLNIEAVNKLPQIVGIYNYLSEERYFKAKKELLSFQIELIQNLVKEEK